MTSNLGMDFCPPRVQNPDVAIPHHVLPVSLWMGRDVCVNEFPLDVQALEVLLDNYLRVSALDLNYLCNRHHVSHELRQGSISLS